MKLKNTKTPYKDVATTLLNSKDQWIKAAMITKAIPQLKFDSQIRRVIHYLRAEVKLPIISSKAGYKYCSDKAEVIKYYDQLRSRTKEIRKAEKGLKKAIKKMK